MRAVVVKKVLLFICLLFTSALYAEPLDEQYYPQRLQWHNVEQLNLSAGRAFIPWDEGQFLRVRFDNAVTDQSVWYSLGDGLFQQMKPVSRDQSQWLFSRPSKQPLLVMLDNITTSTNVDFSKHTKAPKLSVASDRILHPDNQVQTNQTGGYARNSHNRIEAGQALEYVLEGPAEYNFVVRSQWLREYGLSQLMELKLTSENQSTVTEVIKIQPQLRFLLQTDRCECVYSRPEQVSLTIPDGTHIVKVATDRDILGYWTRTDQSDAYFYHKNARQNLKGGSHDKPARQDYSSTGLDNVPAKYFYRELSPNNKHSFASVKPLATSTNRKLYQNKHWQPFNNFDDITPLYFAHIGASQGATYTLPNTTHQPPLRLYLKADEQIKEASFSLLSDGNESINLRYLPDQQLDKALDIKDVDNVAAQFIEFSQPYNSVLLSNHSDAALQIHLGYKNRSEHKTDEIGFVSQLNIDAAMTIIERLMNSNTSLDSVLLEQEVSAWQKRLRSRVQSLLQQYPPTTWQDIGKLQQDVDTVMAKLEVNEFTQLIEVLNSKGMAYKAKKLVVAFALQADTKAKWQRQAQILLLDKLAEQERWFDIEGFWAYRLTHYKQKQAIVELAQVLFEQSLFDQASKWFWLAYKGGLLDDIGDTKTSVPDEAVIAAYISGYGRLQERWFKLRKRKLSPVWQYWQPVDLALLGNSARTLIHNRGLDGYFSATKLDDGQNQSFQLSGPLRLKLTLYPQKLANTQWPASAWLTLQSNRHQRRFLISEVHDSLNLTAPTTEAATLGSRKAIIVDLAAGEQLQGLTLDGQDALFTVHQWQGKPDARPTTPVLLSGETRLEPEAIIANQLPIDTVLLEAVQQKQALPIEVISAINARLAKATATPQQLKLLGEINHSHGWQRLQSVISSGGEKTFAVDVWQPASDKLRLQKALMTGPVNAGERMLSASNNEVIEVQTRSPKSLMLGMRQMSRLGDTPTPVVINFDHNGQSQLLTLGADRSLHYPLSLPPGNHRLRLSYANVLGDGARPRVCFSLSDQHKNSVLPPIKRKYHASTTDRPLVLYVPESTWLRVDELDAQGQINSHNRYVKTAQRLTLPPSNQQQTGYFRVYHWQQDKLKPLPQPELEIETEAVAVAAVHEPVQHTYWMPGDDDAFDIYDKYPLAEQEDGSWGLFSGYRSRRNFDEDEQTSREQFYQTGWRYQLNLPDWDSYFSTSFSVRKHLDTGLQTFVSENDGLWRLNKFWDFTAKVNAYYQVRADNPNIEGAWSVYASTSARWTQYLDDDWKNRVVMTLYVRALSLHESDVYAGLPPDHETLEDPFLEDGLGIDDDVYSDYKEDNKRGLRIADTLEYSPWLDTKVRLQASVTSDSHGNFLNPHKYRLSAGVRQYWQPFIFKLDLIHNRYLRDETDLDNRGDISRNTLRAGVTWEGWSDSGQLWQVDTFVNQDLDGGGSSFGVNFHWDVSNGQGFDDFAPNQLLFGELRNRDSYQVIESNQVASDGHD